MYLSARMSEKLTTKQFGEKVNLTYNRICQLINDGVIQAEKIGRDYVIDPKYIEIVKNRPDNRGRYKRKKASANL